MSGIVGIAQAGKHQLIEEMLDRIGHRGPAGRAVMGVEGNSLGIVWTQAQAEASIELRHTSIVQDAASDERLAQVQVESDRLILKRDKLGVAPLYYGRTEDGALCFASEVKALLDIAHPVNELPPGHTYDGRHLQPYFALEKQPSIRQSPQAIAQELRRRLEASIEKRIDDQILGSWLSGGLDSSAMAALARPYMDQLHTFAAGVPGAPDLEHAQVVADFIQSEHHEIIVTSDDMLTVLPDVIYHLESFDALLVRSSITNYLVAKLASDYVPQALSGEGADELFAGYEYIKALDPCELPDELIDITGRLHNTALQRVDRSASAHGILAHVGFLDPEVVDYAMRIPPELKLRDGVEKWILRQAMQGALPEQVLDRSKAKFWEGAGVGEQLAQHAEEQIGDAEFAQERALPNGWMLNSKEELMYYRIFCEHFGEREDLEWMGRTKGAPIS